VIWHPSGFGMVAKTLSQIGFDFVGFERKENIC
jgi:hypothetical protein